MTDYVHAIGVDPALDAEPDISSDTLAELDTVLTPADGRVVVTGGASGLGAAIVEALRARGATPIVLDRVEPKRDDIDFETVDVTDTEAVTAVVAAIAERYDGLDAVVAAAGVDSPGKLDEVPAEAWERVIRVNLIGMAAVVRAALPALKASHGRVVTVASTLALKGVSDATAYSASKFGVRGFTEALAAETKGELGVTLLIPGGMSTSFFDGRTEQYRPGPDAKLNDPVRVAEAVVFALSQPRGCEVRELRIMHEEEPSWP